MSTITVTNIKATGETASRSATSIAGVWVNLNGTGTAAITDSFNTSAITDNGTGNYTISINNDFSSANYSLTTGIRGVSGSSHAIAVIDIDTALLAGSFKMQTLQSGSSQTAIDCPILNCTAHGDLA